MDRAPRVLLLSDSPSDGEVVGKTLDRAGLKALLQRVESLEGFTRALREFAPDVVLSDHPRRDVEASAALSLVQAARPAAALILLVTYLDEGQLVACLRAGAEAFIMKEDLSRLAHVISSALSVRRRLERVTARQLQVLQLVADGLSTREIARRLELSVKTVETHRGEMMKRLGLHDVVALVRYSVRVGLVAPWPEPGNLAGIGGHI
jgi:DNA-binding NarL/FixJ family response regulator